MSEKNPVRHAVIGTDAMGRNHIRFVTEEPEAELVAIADAFEGARTTAEAAGVPFFTDPAQMMDEVKPGGVIIATPNGLHLSVARETVKHGIVPWLRSPSPTTSRTPRPLPPRPASSWSCSSDRDLPAGMTTPFSPHWREGHILLGVRRSGLLPCPPAFPS